MARSLQYYFNIVFWTNYAIYLLYFIIKYLVAPILWILLELADKSKKNSYVKRILPKRWSAHAEEHLVKFAKITTPMRWAILQLFGGPLGVVERRDDDYKPDKKDDNDIPTLYIRDKKLTYGAIMVLSMLITTFGILTLSSAVNLSLIRITHVCSEDPNIHCYPQLISEANATAIRQFNITININEPILDCTFWDSEGVSSQVTFDCFQFIYNVKAFLATFGGLLTIFTITMKVSTGILLWLNESCNCCMGCCVNGKHTARAMLAAAASVFEVAVAIMCFVLGTSGLLADSDGNSTLLRFIAEHAVDTLIIFGVVATLLWLPWEKYVQKDTQEMPDGDAMEMKEVEHQSIFI
jgi:hypothetical protein